MIIEPLAAPIQSDCLAKSQQGLLRLVQYTEIEQNLFWESRL